VLRYHVSPNGLISTLNDQAERGWLAMCHASSAIAAGAMKNSSGLSLNLSRAHGTSISIKDVGVRLGAQEILNDIDLEIAGGEHIAVVGQSGAGAG